MHKFNKFIPIVIALLLFLVACSTKKNTFTSRTYHNITAHFNTYFNGKEALKQAFTLINNQNVDNYNEILRVFTFDNHQQLSAVSPLCERTIEKGMKVIAKHSMNFNGVEYVKWIDDAYLIIGKARLLKQDYIGAHEIFSHVIVYFDKNSEATEALLWDAITYLVEGKTGQVLNLLVQAKDRINSGFTNKNINKLFYLVEADYYIKVNDYPQAISSIDKALANKQKKDIECRLLFIKAQLLNKLNKNQEALATLNTLFKKNPPYEMTLYGNILAAQCLENTNSKAENIKKSILKLIKDSKNKEYLDALYYALANVELNQKNENQALDYFKLSAHHSSTNQYQKALTYTTLGDIYFNKRLYKEAQAYYDSAVQVMPKNFPDYQKHKNRADVLNELITALNTITFEDSVQQLSKLSEQELLAHIDKLIQNYKLEEQRKKQEEQQKLQQQLANAPVFYNTASTSNEWYFYNSNTLTIGKNEFRQRWGDRPLEDLWRLKNKTPIMEDYDFVDSTFITYDSSKNASDPVKPEFYLKNIPKTPEDFANSNKRIETALYTAGKIYFNNLKEYDEAIYYFQELNNRFPKNEKADEAYYLCYISASEIGRNTDAQACKDSLLRLYPNSFYSHLVLDPEYYMHVSSEEDVASEHIMKTLNALQNNEYTTALALADSGIAKFHDLEMLAKLSYVKAMALANINKRDTLLSILPNIINSYPNTEVASQSKYLLSLLNEKGTIDNTDKANDTTDSINNTKTIYNLPKEDDINLVIISFDPLKITANEMKIAITDFNELSYSSDKFTVNVTFLNDTRMIASIGYFKSKSEALKYYNNIKENQNFKNTLTKGDCKIFIISSINYPIFFKQNDENNYYNFFIEHYIN
ncbi:MAG: tetratricopeptide repeat protein [Bacteroidales bacterium]